jgi:hypothetical protein
MQLNCLFGCGAVPLLGLLRDQLQLSAMVVANRPMEAYGCLEKGFKPYALDPRPHAAAAPQLALRLLISPPAHIDKPIVDLLGLQAATPIDIQVIEDVQRVSNKFSKSAR